MTFTLAAPQLSFPVSEVNETARTPNDHPRDACHGSEWIFPPTTPRRRQQDAEYHPYRHRGQQLQNAHIAKDGPRRQPTEFWRQLPFAQEKISEIISRPDEPSILRSAF
ncbi:hypothetical protein [Streptomyces sp. NBC_01429]|uniref:hypothetical protein n=1 Tax=Streptomyces sp. NBC_01429 TaxID=2903862 RepID=UPI002E2E5D85|nr:hypothetical protein [Streptomyces sp. NBC_01429]